MKAKIKTFTIAQITASAFLLGAFASSFAAGPSNVSPDEALKRLVQGNSRFVFGHMTHVASGQVVEARRAVAKRQMPFAIIVGCSDSRVGPEIVFDQGLRDILAIRTAGQVVGAPTFGRLASAAVQLVSIPSAAL